MQSIKFIIPLLISILPIALQGQTTAVGLRGGWINSGFIGEDASEQDHLSGVTAGAFLNVTADNNIIGFQTELLYSQKGSTIQAGSVSETYKLSYLELPMLLKISAPLSSLRPNVFAGPYVSMKLDETYTYTEAITDISTQTEGNTKATDYGAVFGAGLDIDFANIIITFDGRYNLGMQELENVNEPKDIKNGSFSLNIGVAIKL